QLYNGASMLGGARADSTGHWSATTTTLADGVYNIRATAVDSAGNKSPFSPATTITIDGTPPSGAITAPVSGATVSGSVNVSVAASDAVGVSKVDFQVDGVTQAASTSSPYVYSWNTSGVANGSHTLTAVTTDIAGNTTTSSVTVTVGNSFAGT